jgi:hypothetical protein
MTVIKLGGCNGCGKSTVARAILDLTAEGEPSAYGLASGKRAKFYTGSWKDTPVFVLGKYETACGGMDTISDKMDRYEMIHHFANTYGQNSLIFFEGLITGKTYGALGALSEDMATRKKNPTPWLYAFMDTPFKTCVSRVLERRQAAGNNAPFDPERTMRSTYNSCERLYKKLRTGILYSHPTFMISHTLKPAVAAKQLLNKALEIGDAR